MIKALGNVGYFEVGYFFTEKCQKQLLPHEVFTHAGVNSLKTQMSFLRRKLIGQQMNFEIALEALSGT